MRFLIFAFVLFAIAANLTDVMTTTIEQENNERLTAIETALSE